MRRLRRRYGHATATDKARWDKLRASYVQKREAARDFERGLRVRYGADYGSHGWRQWITRGEKTRLEKLEAAADKVGDKITEMLPKISPRGDAWYTGAPAWWIREKLSWEDATRPVNESLSVEVPAPYGQREGLK
jgi:hypothetical protein